MGVDDKDPFDWKSEDWESLYSYTPVHLYADFHVVCQEPLPSPTREPGETEGYGTVFLKISSYWEYMNKREDLMELFRDKMEGLYPYCQKTLVRFFYHKYMVG